MKGMKVRSGMAARMKISFKRGGKLRGLGKNTSVRSTGGKPTRKGR